MCCGFTTQDRQRGGGGDIWWARKCCMHVDSFLGNTSSQQECVRERERQGEGQELRTLLYICRPVFISVAASRVFPMKLHTHTYIHISGLYLCRGPQKAKDKSQFCHSLVSAELLSSTLQIHGNPIYCRRSSCKKLEAAAKTSQKWL